MNYELAKKLKEAGFPQTGQGSIKWTDQQPNLGIAIYVPTLSELIEACGDDLKQLNNLSDMNRWDAISLESLNKIGTGITPEEAVAELWLELNKKK